MEGADGFFDAVGQFLQPVAHQLVIIAAQGIARDEGLRGVVEHIPAIARLGCLVVDASADDTQRAGHQLRRSRAFRPMFCHIIHRAMPARRQPFQQPHFRLWHVHARDSHSLKAEFFSPRFNLRSELGRVEFAWVWGLVGHALHDSGAPCN